MPGVLAVFRFSTKVIVERGVVIPEGTVVGEDADEDARRFERTEAGMTLITREMIVRYAPPRA
jgi:glucose-1-phosphate adenylyltransferase